MSKTPKTDALLIRFGLIVEQIVFYTDKARELFETLRALEIENADLLEIAIHTHVGPERICKKCNRDLTHPAHKRATA